MSREDIDRIDEVIRWYQSSREWLENLAAAFIRLPAVENPPDLPILPPADLLFLTPREVDNVLNQKLDRLSLAASLQLFASFEGAIRYDTLRRKSKARVGRDLKRLLRRKKRSLKDIDVIEIVHCWCERYGIEKKTFGVLKGLFQYRHWLAHGRYWNNLHLPVSKSAISPMDIYVEMRYCFDELKNYEPDFDW
jgi:hypothetical protein